MRYDNDDDNGWNEDNDHQVDDDDNDDNKEDYVQVSGLAINTRFIVCQYWVQPEIGQLLTHSVSNCQNFHIVANS